MFKNYITVRSGRIKTENSTFDQYLPVLLDIWHRLSHQNKFPSVAFCALAQQSVLPCKFSQSVERTWVTRQENLIKADDESLLTAQPSLIWWDYKNYTQNITYTLCATETTCLHSLNGHNPYHSIYSQPQVVWQHYTPFALLLGESKACKVADTLSNNHANIEERGRSASLHLASSPNKFS